MEYLKDHILSLMRKSAYRPMTMRELFSRFNVPAARKSNFTTLIKQLTASGEIIRIKGKRYGLAKKMNLVTGRLQAHPEGYGFVTPEGEKREGGDIFIKARNLDSAMHGDLVVVRLDKNGKGRSPEGTIVRILQHAHKKVVGKLERFPGYGYVVPANYRLQQDIYIPLRHLGEAQTGQVVVAEITTYPMRNRNPEGRIIEVLGDDRAPGVGEEVIIRQFDLPHSFSKKVSLEAAAIPQKIPAASLKNRLDLREKLTVTIDGESARDFDDAISIELSPKMTYLLWVHVADVSHYVQPGSLLDDEAFERGTSVYFPDRVLPMLPEALSTGICSLNPDEDRLAMTVQMEFSRQGKLVRHDFFETAIRSKARLTYTQVARALENSSADELPSGDEIFPAVELMRDLAARIRSQRQKRGSIDFDLPEAEILLDLRGNIREIIRAERNVAHQIIEEFMIAANETVAGYFHWLKVPALYRVHEKPDQDKIDAFAEFSASFGHRFPSSHQLQPKLLSEFLATLKDAPEERILNQVLLRSMKQASYSMENIGHFGLASQTYTHFTSPIRRYPDLVVHRLLRELLHRGRFPPDREDELIRSLPTIASHSSERERIAIEAEREVVTLKKVEFMEDKVKEVFEGFITSVVPFGFFVELRDYMIEGLVHISTLGDDYYIYQEKRHALLGDHTKKVFRLGDPVKVRIKGVSREKRQVDFTLIPETAAAGKGDEKPPAKRKRRSGRKR